MKKGLLTWKFLGLELETFTKQQNSIRTGGDLLSAQIEAECMVSSIRKRDSFFFRPSQPVLRKAPLIYVTT